MQHLLKTLLILPLVACALIMTVADAMEPISAGSVTAVDFPDASAGEISITLDAARFGKQAVGHVVLKAKQLDLNAGLLSSLNLDLKNGQFGDRLQLADFNVVTEAFQFDSFELLNKQRFVLSAPVEGQVALHLTEENLNEYLGHEKTLKQINKAITKQLGGFQLVKLAQPHFTIMPQQKLALSINAVLGGSVAIPLNLLGQLEVIDGNIQLQNLSVVSQQTQLPIEVSGIIEQQLNKVINLEKLSSDKFKLRATKLETRSHQAYINGTAQIEMLSF